MTRSDLFALGALAGFATGAAGAGLLYEITVARLERDARQAEVRYRAMVNAHAAADRAEASTLAYTVARVERCEAALVKCRAPITAGAVVPFEVTAYGLGCDAPGPLTAAGVEPVAGHTIAADPAVLPIGSRVRIAGKGERQVQDVGGAVKGRTLDLYFDDCDEARRFGRQVRAVEVLHVGGQR